MAGGGGPQEMHNTRRGAPRHGKSGEAAVPRPRCCSISLVWQSHWLYIHYLDCDCGHKHRVTIKLRTPMDTDLSQLAMSIIESVKE